MPSLTGKRLLPIEDVPADAFRRTLPREVPPRPGQIELIHAIYRRYAPNATIPLFKRVKPLGAGVFGGRWLANARSGQRGFVVWAHSNARVEKAVTIHESCHDIRKIYGRDRTGRHDQAFLAMVEDAYRSFGVSCATAKLVEGQYPPSWSW